MHIKLRNCLNDQIHMLLVGSNPTITKSLKLINGVFLLIFNSNMMSHNFLNASLFAKLRRSILLVIIVLSNYSYIMYGCFYNIKYSLMRCPTS